MNIQLFKNISYSIFYIALCLGLGKMITHSIGGLPGSLYGMIIMNTLLYFNIIKVRKIEQSISWIIQNMGVCFVPAGVGIINHYDLIAQHGFSLVFIIFISTFILLTTVGIFIERSTSNEPTKRGVD